MRISTIFRYLFGGREAILEIAADPRWLLAGFLFVLSAGFAREYDGTDLLVHGDVLLRPLIASTVAAAVLYGALRMVGVFPGPSVFAQQQRREFGFPEFLALFWMTAPLAWLYAVPVERFLDPLHSMAANLWFLASVAAWRVMLMIRVAAVIGGCGHLAAASLVLLIVEVPVLVAAQIHFMFDRVVGSMAGVRMWASPTDELVHDTVKLIAGALCWSVPVLAAATFVAVTRPREWIGATLPAPRPGSGRPVFAVAVGFLLAGVALLPFFQPEQQRRTAVERLYREEKFGEMLAELSAHTPGDYPPHWQPPPEVGVFRTQRMCAIVCVIADRRLGSARFTSAGSGRSSSVSLNWTRSFSPTTPNTFARRSGGTRMGPNSLLNSVPRWN